MLEGTAPDELRAQYLERLEALGLAVPEHYSAAGCGYHTAAGANRPAILDWGAVTAQLSMESFLRDGVLVLRSVFTPEATRRLRESCENVQRQNDVSRQRSQPAQQTQRPPPARLCSAV